jgi:hypothetical protein
MFILIVSFGGLFEHEDDGEDDSIPVNFQTGSEGLSLSLVSSLFVFRRNWLTVPVCA